MIFNDLRTANKIDGERGAFVVFLAAFLLPFIWLVFSLFIDVATYYTATAKIQRTLDAATTYGQQFLPYSDAATSAVKNFLQHSTNIADSVELTVSEDKIEIYFEGRLPLIFGSLLGSKGVTLSARSVARGATSDVLIVLDTSSYLSPNLFEDEYWGTDSNWPSASFLSDMKAESTNDDGSIVIADGRALTQQCYNEYFSALKSGAIRLYEAFSYTRSNAVGVSIVPGTLLPYGVINSVEARPDSGEPSSSVFWRRRERHMSGDLCAATAEREFRTTKYRFPATQSDLSGSWTPPQGAPVYLVNTQDLLFNEHYAPFLSPQQTIWAQSTAFQDRVTFESIFSSIRAELIGSNANPDRGGLTNYTQKRAFILLGDTPLSSNGIAFSHSAARKEFMGYLTQIANDLNSLEQSLELSFVFLISPKVQNGTAKYQQFKEFTSKVQAERLRVSTFLSSSPTTFTNELIPHLLLAQRNTLLSR